MKIPAYAKVRIPNMPGKITFSKKGSGAVYVMLQYDRVYDPKRKFNIAKRVLIGRVADGEAREWLYPNKNFPKYFPDVKLSPLFGDEPKPLVKSETQGKVAAEAEAKADAQPQEKRNTVRSSRVRGPTSSMLARSSSSKTLPRPMVCRR